jgi:alpha-glucoside transport system permease protein
VIAFALAAVIVVVVGLTGSVTTAELVSLVLLVAGLAVLAVVLTASSYADNLDLGSPTASLALIFAAIMLALAVFSTLQSVLWNNLWWVATVTGLSTVLGLMLAILADRAKGETTARTFIFLPMAISMVGAAVIWDFVFELQAFGNQTGLANAILQGIGFKARGFFINSTMIPWNNFWIMLIMVWIQTGFAMVILSAAIKGVPDELIEASRVDGASEVQVFWRVIIPQIRTTIIVVITMMKVFDLVKATTGGANRTNVLANEMFNQLRDANFSLSSAFAVVIFALVLPVMVYNVRSNLKELS